MTTETSLLQPSNALSAIEEAYCGKVMTVAVAQDPTLQFAQTGKEVGLIVIGALLVGFKVVIIEGTRVDGFVEGASVLGFAEGICDTLIEGLEVAGFAEGLAVSTVEGTAELGFPEGLLLAGVRVGTDVGSDPGEETGKPGGKVHPTTSAQAPVTEEQNPVQHSWLAAKF